MKATEKIAEFIADFGPQRLGQAETDAVKTAVLDYTGVALAGLDEPETRLTRQLVQELGGAPQATLWGAGGQKTSLANAALVLGVAAHAHDYDDTNAHMMSHPSIQMLSGLLALAEARALPGARLIAAYAAGYEVGVKLGRAINPALVLKGWFPVGVLGVMMQAAAASSLIGLDAPRAAHALGLAANMASGLRANNGAMAKPLLAGHLASSGLMAALLAEKGATANPRAIEDRFGWFENFSQAQGWDLEKAVGSLGLDPLEIMASGPSYKLYPCCAGGHMVIDGVLELGRGHGLKPGQIAEIRPRVSEGIHFLLIHHAPQTPAEAKFSLEYAAARAALDGRMGLAQFTAQKVKEEALIQMMGRVKPDYFPEPGANGDYRVQPVGVSIRLRDGRAFSTQVAAARGTPANPVGLETLEEKFFDCAAPVLGRAAAKEVSERIKGLEMAANIAPLAALLAGGPR